MRLLSLDKIGFIDSRHLPASLYAEGKYGVAVVVSALEAEVYEAYSVAAIP